MRVSSFLQSKGISCSDTARAISDGRVGVKRAGQPNEESITKDVEIGYGDKVLVIIGNNTSTYDYKVAPRDSENIWHLKPFYWIVAGILVASALVAVHQARQNRLENERKASNCIISTQYDLCKTVDLSGIEPSNAASIRRIISQREAEIALESERYQRQVQEQRRLAVIEDNKRRAEDERRKAEIKAAEDERAYKAARIYVVFSNSTGEVIAKATIVRKDVRSYTSLGNNKMAQVVYELFDAGGIPITNSTSGFNRHEFRVNCDTREPLTRSMNVSYNSGGTGTLNFTGYMSDEVCKTAGL